MATETFYLNYIVLVGDVCTLVIESLKPDISNIGKIFRNFKSASTYLSLEYSLRAEYLWSVT